MSVMSMNRNMDRMDDLPKLKPSRYYLAELIFNSVHLRKIAELTGWSEFTVRKFLKEYNLPTPYEFKQILREMWQNRIAALYMRLNGINGIASQTPFNWNQVTNILNDMGLLTDLHLGAHLMKARAESWRPLSPHLQQVLEGEMLGDGCLGLTATFSPSRETLPNNNEIINALDDLQWFSLVDVDTEPTKLEKAISLFNITRETLSYLQGAVYLLNMALHAADWVEHVATEFRAGGYYVNVYPGKWVDEDGVEHPRIHLQTEASLNLFKERLKWYHLVEQPDGSIKWVKGVPWTINLTSSSLLHWLMGDGSFNNDITFSTQGFHLSDVMFLAIQLRRKVGVRARLFWQPPRKNSFSRKNNAETDPIDPNRHWAITLPVNRSSRTRFLDYLSMAPGYEDARRIFPWKFSKSVQKQDCV